MLPPPVPVCPQMILTGWKPLRLLSGTYLADSGGFRVCRLHEGLAGYPVERLLCIAPAMQGLLWQMMGVAKGGLEEKGERLKLMAACSRAGNMLEFIKLGYMATDLAATPGLLDVLGLLPEPPLALSEGRCVKD